VLITSIACTILNFLKLSALRELSDKYPSHGVRKELLDSHINMLNGIDDEASFPTDLTFFAGDVNEVEI
jgi:hypothetical protein